jgi:2-iminobutanoate/2-iminopropanoate deaminase
MTQKTIINPSALPPPSPWLSRAIRVGDLVFVSGTSASPDPATGKLDPDIRAQVRNCLETIGAILEGAGTSLSNVVSVTSYLKDPRLFPGYNEEYVKFFPTDPPTRTTVQAAMMRPEMLVEITTTAVIPS